MITYAKKAFLTLSILGLGVFNASAEEGENKGFTHNIVTGRGNVIVQEFGPETIIHTIYRNGNGNQAVFMCGKLVDEKADSIKITNVDCVAPDLNIKTKKIKLTGTKKRVPLKGAIDTVSLPPYIADVTITDRDSYIECDTAVFDAGIDIKAANGRLEHRSIKKNTSTKFTGTGGKPLCSIFAKLLNGSLTTEHSSRVKINTPTIHTLNTNHSSIVSADENTKLNQLRSLSASHSSTVDLPNVSVPMLTTNVAHSANVTLAGRVQQHNLGVHHSSSFDGSKLKSEYVNIDAAHGSKTKLWVTKMLQGFASFQARIWYKGDAQNRVNTSWGATCEKNSK